jgi:hypothetical protein
MKELSIELRDMARKAGLCDKWFGEWDDDSNNEVLFDKYKRGIDFSIDKDWISNDFIKSHWDKETLQSYNIFVDDKGIKTENEKGIIIINGDSDIEMEYGNFDTADIYIRHTSNVKINALGFSRIMVNIYDDAIVEINCSEMAKVYVYKHSKKCNIKSVGENECLIRDSSKQ